MIISPCAPVWASGDNPYCNFSFSLTDNDTDICSNLPFIAPSNDSRTNLILLMNNASVQQSTLKQLYLAQKSSYPSGLKKGDHVSSIPLLLSRYDTYYKDKILTYKVRVSKVLNADKQAVKKLLHKAEQAYLKHNPKNTTDIWCDQCLNSDTLAMLDYLQQLSKADNLSPQQKQSLALARYALYRDPLNSNPVSYIPAVSDDIGLAFIDYLVVSSAFYKGQYAEATKLYTNLLKTVHPWIKEASTYMIARSLLQQGQAVGFNKWGELDLSKVDRLAVRESFTAFGRYIKTYPKGLYVNSAKGLIRRIYWLQGDEVALAEQYEYLLNNPKSYHSSETFNKSFMADLVLEIDNKVFFNNNPINMTKLKHTPKLLAVADLLRMRADMSKKISLRELQAQKSTFRAYPELYQYILASYYTYVQPDAVKVLELLPALDSNTVEPLSYFKLSEQVLRALALESQSKWDDAEALWLQLMPLAAQYYQSDLIELGLALNYEQSDRVEKALLNSHLISTPQLRYSLLRKNSSRSLLKQLIVSDETTNQQKASMLYLLLYKDLLSQNYVDFLEDSELLITYDKLERIPLGNIRESSPKEVITLDLFSQGVLSYPEYECPSPIALAAILKNYPNDANALNCLGNFAYVYQLPYADYMVGGQHPKSLGNNRPTPFGKVLFSRLKGYQQVIANDKAPDDDRAYALYQAIRCFRRVGINRCDNQQIPKAERARWFRLLKSTYKDTIWAKRQTIYW